MSLKIKLLKINEQTNKLTNKQTNKNRSKTKKLFNVYSISSKKVCTEKVLATHNTRGLSIHIWITFPKICSRSSLPEIIS